MKIPGIKKQIGACFLCFLCPCNSENDPTDIANPTIAQSNRPWAMKPMPINGSMPTTNGNTAQWIAQTKDVANPNLSSKLCFTVYSLNAKFYPNSPHKDIYILTLLSLLLTLLSLHNHVRSFSFSSLDYILSFYDIYPCVHQRNSSSQMSSLLN